MFEDSSGSLSQLAHHLTQRQSQVGQGNLPWSLPRWLQPSQLRAGITPAFQGDQCPPKNASHEGQQGANSHSPALLCHNHPSPGAESAEPRACSGVRPGVTSSGLCWQLPSHLHHLPSAKTRAVSLQGPSVPGQGAAQLPFSWGHIQVDRAPHLPYI